MEKSLQYRFLESHGNPLQIGNMKVIQCDRLAISKGIVKLRFLSEATGKQGVALKAKKGGIRMSDGKRVQRLNIWHETNLPPNVEYEVECPTGELTLWNIYRMQHPDGSMTEDEWTGNAGMIIVEQKNGYRRYGCSDSFDTFSPANLEFEVEWDNFSVNGKSSGGAK
ncbi:MAG: hypothetical protein IT365_27430 [Candidatus Hydrogenedentes bacterium]|nr:hypothetical protein [Candidatus Hydrogenedentota bacterium]